MLGHVGMFPHFTCLFRPAPADRNRRNKKTNSFETAEKGAAFVALPHFSPQRSSCLDCLCADADKPALGDLAFIYFARFTALVAAAVPSLGSFSRSGLRSRAAASVCPTRLAAVGEALGHAAESSLTGLQMQRSAINSAPSASEGRCKGKTEI